MTAAPVNVDGGYVRQLPEGDATLTSEWLDSLDEVIDAHGTGTARMVLTRLLHWASEKNVGYPPSRSTPYLNSIPPADQPPCPSDIALERRIEALVRWNAAVMVSRANARSEGIGGHLSTPASATCLYEMGFNHFFRGKDGGAGDQVFFQGHATPGIYARAYLEGRLSEEQVDGFRREIGGGGLSSYPHPRLMPAFWEFPTVSMGLGPINAIYQARFNRYLAHRGIADTGASTVWCFLGDGECDEPETLGALSIAARERLDNLVFVVNCNLQRLDGPVRGNGKIIQELEAVFRGAGWNAIKVVWGSRMDGLLAQDRDGALVDKLNTTLDGEYQKYAVEGPAYMRERFFGSDPRLARLVEDLDENDPVFTLPRGRARPGQAARRLRGGRGPRGCADRDPGQDPEGRPARVEDRVPQRCPPGEEAPQGPGGRAAGPPEPGRRDPRGGPGRRAPTLRAPARRFARGTLPARSPEGPGRARPPPGAAVPLAGPARRQGVRRPAEGVGGAGRVHDHGLRRPPPGPGAGRGRGPSRGAHRARRGPHLRPRPAVRRGQDLHPLRAALRAGGRLHEAGAAREAVGLLAEHHDVAAELWSVTSYKALREDALRATRWNRLHPTELPRTPRITAALHATEGPCVAVTDFMKAVPDQVARWVPGQLTTLGTDGYGRSDSRAALRRHFETDASHLAVAVLAAMAEREEGKPEEVADAIARYDLEPEAVEPLLA